MQMSNAVVGFVIVVALIVTGVSGWVIYERQNDAAGPAAAAAAETEAQRIARQRDEAMAEAQRAREALQNEQIARQQEAARAREAEQVAIAARQQEAAAQQRIRAQEAEAARARNAAAQVPSAVGHWRGVLARGTNSWYLNADGTFTTDYSAEGTWTQNGNRVTLYYTSHEGYRTELTISGNRMTGQEITSSGSRHNMDVTRQGVAAAAAASPIGRWDAASTWDGYDPQYFQVEFRSDGTFLATAPNAPSGTGTWSQSGSTITWQYNSTAQTRYSGRISGSTITGTMTNNSGGTGSFRFTRR